MRFLAWGIGAVGAVCVYLMYRPGGLREALGAVVDFGAGAVAHPLVPAAALIAVVATVIARALDRPDVVERRKRVHAVDVRGDAPAGARGETEALRLRLGALLRGRGDTMDVIDELLAGAVRCRASDVHLQPRQGSTRVALRVEGELVDVGSAAAGEHARLARRIKVLADLAPYKTDVPQDGRFTLTAAETAIDVRVSVVPTRHGEKVALRLLRPGVGLRQLVDLGMDAGCEAAFVELLGEPQGLVVLTGPTGSGKTTTLYAALSHIHATRGATTQIATIEDPVEIELPFLSQTQVDRARDLDFAAGLRALLRQDPNVLMVGEIRDPETAQIAVQAGLTGHLILTSLHAESTAGVFARLIDMGVEPFLVASSVAACVSQRLVRRLCPECRRPAPASRDAAARLARLGVAVDGMTFYRGEGCPACGRSGHRGRVALFELLRVTPDLRRRVAAGIPTQEVEEAMRAAGWTSLDRVALEAAAAGRISLDEALRVAG